MRIADIVLLGALGWLLATSSVAAQEADAAQWNGRWQTQYVDDLLGPVHGRARIDVEAQAAEVIYRHPKTGAEHRLVSTLFERQGSDLKIVLSGQSPAFAAADGRNYPVTDIVVPETSATATAAIGNSSLTVPLAPRRPSDEAEVTLELTLADLQTLRGSWHYRADPLTRRAHDGLGRIGIFETLSDGGGRQSGGEIWTRPVPQIVTAFALDPQTGWNRDLVEPLNPHPFQDDRHRREQDRRFVVIAGYELPAVGSDPVDFVSLEPSIAYGRVIDPDSTFKSVPGHLEPFVDARAKTAERLEADLGREDAKKLAASLDYLIVEATLRDGITPGMQRFALNGTASGWTLAFGNNGAQIRFVRPIDPAAVPDRRLDSFDVVIKNPDQTVSRARIRVEASALTAEDGVAAATALTVRPGESLEGDLSSAEFFVLTPDTRERFARLGLSFLRGGEVNSTGRPQVVTAGSFRGAYGTLTIDVEGNFTYTADPLRWLSTGYEPTERLFAPEVVRVALRSDLVLPREKIDITLGHGAEILQFAGRRTLPVMRDAKDPHLYLSAPIYLPPAGTGSGAAPPPGTTVLPAAIGEGDRLFAAIADPGLISVPPAPAAARVYTTPGRMENGQSYLWKDHLKAAHACYDDLGEIDWDGSDFDFVATLEEDLHFEWWKVLSLVTTLFASETLETNFQLGDHAALLMLRHVFVTQAEARIKEYRRLAEADRYEVAAFWIATNPYRWGSAGGGHPLNSLRLGIEVPMQDGSSGPFGFTYFDNSSSGGLLRIDDPKKVPIWIVAATRSALGSYAETIRESLATADETDACDVRELVELVGAHFDNVEAQLRPRLMRLSGDAPLRWEPDYHGRLRIRQVASKLWQMRAHQRLSEEDTQQALQYISIATLPAGAAGATATVILAGFNAAAYAATEVPKYLESQEEIAFARGAADVLGLTRLETAVAREYSGTDLAIGFLVTLGGDVASGDMLVFLKSSAKRVADAGQAVLKARLASPRAAVANAFRRLRAGPRYRAVRRGAAIVNAADFDLDSFLLHGHPRDAADVAEFLSYALRRESSGAALEPVQLAALERFRAARDQAAGLADTAFTGELRALADVEAVRPDLRRLVREARGVVETALAAGGRRRAEALALLRFSPQSTGEAFQAALEARLARVRQPLGEAFYDMADPGNRAVAGLLEDNGWAVAVTPRESGGHHVKIAAPGGYEDALLRGFDPETGVLDFVSGYRDNIPGHIDIGLPVPLSEKGVPAFLFAQLRFMQEMGIGYAGQGGNLLRRLDMGWVLNARTNAQLTWFRNTYHPGRSFADLQAEGLLDDFILQTRSVEYASSLIEQSGYRVKAARFAFFGEPGRLWPLGKRFRVGAEGETWEAFMRRYGLGQTDPGPPGIRIEIDVEPNPAAVGGRETSLETARLNLEMPPEATQRLDLEVPGPDQVESPAAVRPPGEKGAAPIPDDFSDTLPPPAAGEFDTTIIERAPLAPNDEIERMRAMAMHDLGNQVPGAAERLALIQDAEAALGRGSAAERQFGLSAARMMSELGVPEVRALQYAGLHHRAVDTSELAAGVFRGQLVAEAILYSGTRPVRLERFMAATGLTQSAAQLAVEEAASRMGLAVLPGEIRPASLYPPALR
ncbi:hypothetical protein [Pelagibius marinus]|uniref:hypothetical protein n=1 Tax=Pelagibius marinus TaxID=2762760 RepID=UPI0018723A36|nr:hypothetical protein [Pelagibius marinus]